MPRFKEQDKFVYDGLKHLVDQIGNIQDRNLANYFKDMEVPASYKRIKRIPNWFVSWLSRKIKKSQDKYPDSPVEIGFPFPNSLRLLIKSLFELFADGCSVAGAYDSEAYDSSRGGTLHGNEV